MSKIKLLKNGGYKYFKYNDSGKLCNITFYNKLHKVHRDNDRPAVFGICDNKTWYKYYMVNGKPHRGGDKPAYIEYLGNQMIKECYWKNGKEHRESGPSYIIYDMNDPNKIIDCLYYVNDVNYTYEEFKVHQRKKILNQIKNNIK